MGATATYTYGGVTFPVDFGMLTYKAIAFDSVMGNGEMTGVEFLVKLIYEGNRSHARLSNTAPAFKNESEVWQLMNDHCMEPESIATETAMIGFWNECRAYKSNQDETPEDDATDKKK